MPALGRSSVVRILIVVVLPAPFGPSSPKSSPRSTSKLIPRSASTSVRRCRTMPLRERYVRQSSLTSIAATAPSLDARERFTGALRCARNPPWRGGMLSNVRRVAFSGVLTVLVALAATASAVAAAPSATTGPTTAVGSTSATVTGSVNPGGQSTTWYVEYGKSTSYGSKTRVGECRFRFGRCERLGGSVRPLLPAPPTTTAIVATNGAGTDRGPTRSSRRAFRRSRRRAALRASAPTSATSERNRRPERPRHDLLLRVRHDVELRDEDVVEGRRFVDEPAVRVRRRSPGCRPVAPTTSASSRSSDAGTSTGKDATFATSGAPSVETGSAASITPTSATLTGAVTPNGLSTTWWFEYGTTTGYGTKTGSHGAGSGSSATKASLGVKSLKVGTTYHYRLVAQNSSGKTVGDDRTFSTVGAPASVTGAAPNVGPDYAVVSGSLDTRGRSTTWWFEYGTTTGYGHSTAAKSAGSKAGAQSVSADADRSDRRDDLPLPARREERRRHHARGRRGADDERCDAERACARGDLRRTDQAVRRRADAPGRRAGGRVRAAVRWWLVPLGLDRVDERRGRVDVHRAAPDHDVVRGGLEGRDDRAGHGRRAPARSRSSG